jgi:hypothetical protein
METAEERDKMVDAGHVKVADVPFGIGQFVLVDNVSVIHPYIANRDHPPRDNHVGLQFDKRLD